MGNSISIFFLIEAVGTIAFASSGAMVAIRQNLDLLGIIVLGVTTAVGGGMMRDILLGSFLPASLQTRSTRSWHLLLSWSFLSSSV